MKHSLGGIHLPRAVLGIQRTNGQNQATKNCPSIINAAATTLFDVGQNNGKISVLFMASPLRPDGHRRDELRRISMPAKNAAAEIGTVFTPDVLVLRNSQGNDLPKMVHSYTDVVTVGLLRFPDLEDGQYVNSIDAEVVFSKMRAVMRVTMQKRATRIVLSAWGCGAYHIPVSAIAEAWKKVLLRSRKRKEVWRGVQEVVFAITDSEMVNVFKTYFADVIV